ncbi:MAG: hypothetical protein HYT42_02285 [Candidatus Sungbacteria bacterium]|nr:hypothetical protein [Candidatus Sungbacteria bacterium]
MFKNSYSSSGVGKIPAAVLAALKILLLFLISARTAFGQGSPQGIQNPIYPTESFTAIIVKIADWASAIAVPLMALVVLFAGYTYLTSGGNADQVKRANKTLTWAVVGFIIVLLAKSAAVLIKNILGVR